MLAWFENAERICSDTLKDQDLAYWVFQKILVGARNKNREHTEPKPDEESIDTFGYTREILHQVLDLTKDNAARDQNPKLREYFDAIYIWIMTMQETWLNRALFATENGRLGFGSKDIQEGDLVCMLYSGRTMYILRPQQTDPKTYRFVSDAYVFRCMDGEVFDLLDEGEVKESLFAIT